MGAMQLTMEMRNGGNIQMAEISNIQQGMSNFQGGSRFAKQAVWPSSLERQLVPQIDSHIPTFPSLEIGHSLLDIGYSPHWDISPFLISIVSCIAPMQKH